MSSSPSPAPHADATAAVDRAIASEDTPFLLLLIGPPVSAAGTALPHVSWIDDVAADGGGGGGGGSTEVKVTDLLRTVARTLSSTPSKASPRPSVVLSSAAATADGRVRAVCAHIAQVVGVRYLVHVLAPDVWLSRDTDAVGATTTEEGGADDRWKTAMEWASRLPGPLEYAQGVSVTTTPAYHPGEPRPGALAYRDGSIDQATSDALGGDRFLSHEGAVGVKAACVVGAKVLWIEIAGERGGGGACVLFTAVDEGRVSSSSMSRKTSLPKSASGWKSRGSPAIIFASGLVV